MAKFNIPAMTGKLFLFKAKEYRISDINAVENGYEVQTNRGVLEVKYEQLRDEFLPVEEETGLAVVRPNHQQIVKIAAEQSGKMNELSDILMQTIATVREAGTPEEIEAATRKAGSINDLAKTMIDLGRTQTEAVVSLVR